MSALWEPITLGEHFLRGAEQYGDRIALSDGTQKVTYRQLVELAGTDRERLRQAGVQPHELVIMQMSNGIPFVQMFLALMLEEIVPILMLPNHGVRELTGIQSKVHCRFHLTDDGIQHFTGMKQVAYVAPEAVVKAQSPDARIAILLLSGGTTGIPKLIPRTHGDYYYSCMQTANKNHWSDQTTLLTPLPLGHNFALAHPGILGVLFHGGKAVVPRYASPLDMLNLIRAEQVNALILVPALLHLLMEARELLPEADLSTLRQIYVGGAMLPVADAERTVELFGNVLIQVFGTAEGLVCTTQQDDPLEKILTTQGTPVSPHDELRIVDGSGDLLPAGQRGELLTRGPYTIHYYYGILDKDNQYFTSDGWYKTGDLASIDAQGYITIHGRIKERINRAGEKIIPSYLEGLLTEWGVFSEVAVIGVPDPVLTERICICGKPISGADMLDLGQINHFLKEKGVSGFCMGDDYLEVHTWPLTAVGKTDKKQLLKLAEEQDPNSGVLPHRRIPGAEPRRRPRPRLLGDSGDSHPPGQAAPSVAGRPHPPRHSVPFERLCGLL